MGRARRDSTHYINRASHFVFLQCCEPAMVNDVDTSMRDVVFAMVKDHLHTMPGLSPGYLSPPYPPPTSNETNGGTETTSTFI